MNFSKLADVQSDLLIFTYNELLITNYTYTTMKQSQIFIIINLSIK